jgi:CH-like domain in sperm protein
MSKLLDLQDLDEDEIQVLYEWVDEIPLSRPKRNITRDFADGAMVAELIKNYHPRLIELHNYPLAHSTQQKTNNWNILNTKVFKKMGFQISRNDIDKIVTCVPQTIEKVLFLVKQKIEEYVENKPEEPRVEEKPTGNKKKGTIPDPKPAQLSNSALKEKEQVIQELKETIEIMESKINKLEQLVKLKDSKIQILTNKLTAAGIS